MVPTVKEIISNVNLPEFKDSDIKAAIAIVRKHLNEEKIKLIKEEMKNELDVSRRKRLYEKIIEIKRGCVGNNEEE